MAISGVLRPGHVCIRVLDMDEAVTHYVERLGLIEVDRDDQGRVYLKAWEEYDAFSVVLRQADEPGMDFMSFKVKDADTLASLTQDVKDYGLEVNTVAAGELNDCGERVQFVIPTGHTIELFADKKQTGKWNIPDENPDAWPEGLKGMKACRFDHCLLYGDDIDGTLDFFTKVLGFDLTEQAVDGDLKIGIFLSCSNKAHDVAFIRHPEKNKFHHASFLLNSWEDLLKAADLISMHDISLDIGPTRHGLTHGKTIYFFDPSGNRNETFAGGHHWYPDQPVITWTADQIGKAIFYHDRALNERFLNVVT